MFDNLDRIREALQFINASDRNQWVSMGMAIKSELGDTGFDAWDTWSQQADSYKANDARDVWKNIKIEGGVTIGTLFHEAKTNGWRDDGYYQKPTPEELAERKRIATEQAEKEEAEIIRERANTAAKAKAIWDVATEAKANHPYLFRKQVSPVATLREIDAGKAAVILGYAPKSSGEPLTGRLLAVPVKQNDKLSTLELIDESGRKAALAGRGSKAGGYWANEHLPYSDGNNLTLLIGEGVVTVLSAREATGYLGIAALSSSNLQTVAKIMLERYPAAALVILADLVKSTGESDPHALETAQSVDGRLAVPDFGTYRNPEATDFNDMAGTFGLEAVASAITYAIDPPSRLPGINETRDGDSNGWPEPQPMTLKIEAEPYPIDALPGSIRAAVEEVAGFVKAPLPLVASSALGAISLAGQAHIDAKRADRLHGPSGLFLLTIADSGERKSTCDGFFACVIHKYQKEQAEAMKPAIKEYQAGIAAWEAEREGLLSAIKETGKKGKPTNDLKTELTQLQQEKPEPPRVPRLLYSDVTPEALTYGLAKQWPSAGIMSSEAGMLPYPPHSQCIRKKSTDIRLCLLA